MGPEVRWEMCKEFFGVSCCPRQGMSGVYSCSSLTASSNSCSPWDPLPVSLAVKTL